MKNVKRIDFRIKFEGKGIVNFDDSDQKWMFSAPTAEGKRHHLSARHDNNMYGKKNFYTDEKGNLKYRTKISNNAMMHEIFKGDCVAQTTELQHHEETLLHYLASPAAILRAYLIMLKGSNSFKRKSAIAITDAEDVNFSQTYLETFSRSGSKNMNAEETDNSFFKKETTGDVTYTAEASINLQELQFMSLSEKFDRLSFNPDLFSRYKKILKMQMPKFNSELGYYLLKTSNIKIPELGFLFSNEDVVFLTKEFVTRLCQFNLAKRGGYARIAEVQYKLITDPIEHMFDKNSGWVTLKSSKDIDSINFTVDPSYVETDFKAAHQLISDIENDVKQAKEQAKEKVAAKNQAQEKVAAKKQGKTKPGGKK